MPRNIGYSGESYKPSHGQPNEFNKSYPHPIKGTGPGDAKLIIPQPNQATDARFGHGKGSLKTRMLMPDPEPAFEQPPFAGYK